jgi:hypothetical protein
VSRGLWWSVGYLLNSGVSETLRRHALEQAAERANDIAFTLYILPHYNDRELESVFPQLVTRGVWWSVANFLTRGVGDKHRKHAVEQAANKADDDDFTKYILPHCSD